MGFLRGFLEFMAGGFLEFMAGAQGQGQGGAQEHLEPATQVLIINFTAG